jgi:ABC-type transport system involved in multi-copper enzyme maturation permease subunit
MDASSGPKPVRFNRFLPYWAVLLSDMAQTYTSWIFRAWVFVSLMAAVGYLLYRFGAYREAGMVQHASHLISDLLRWTIFGSVTLIIVLTSGCISGERGTMADSVLCRGISRNQFFLGKLHARLFTILTTFLVLAVVSLAGSVFLLHEDLTLTGCLVALAVVAAFLATVITFGVTISALTNSTLIGVTLLWIILYGGGIILSLLPATIPSPDRALAGLPAVLRGNYDLQTVARLIGCCGGICFVVTLFGLVSFGRRDV